MWFQPTIILPPSDLQWLLDQPSHNVVQPIVQSHTNRTHNYLPCLPRTELFHATAIRVDLRRIMTTQTRGMWRRIGTTIDHLFSPTGDDGDWTAVDVAATAKAVALSSIVRAFFGEELSSDAAFASDLAAFSAFFNGTIIPQFFFVPGAVKPLLAPLFALPARLYVRRINRKLIPIVERLLAEAERGDGACQWLAEPRDVVQLHVAAARRKPEDRDARRIASRLLLIVGAAAIDTTFGGISNALLDLASGPTVAVACSNAGYERGVTTEHLDTIRREAMASVRGGGEGRGEAGQAEEGGETTGEKKWMPPPPLLPALVHADSFVREVLRRRTFLARQVYRIVVAEGGLPLPERSCGSGSVAPKGTWLAQPSASVHWDDEVWEEAEAFKPWRFVDKASDPPATLPNSASTTPSEAFLSFGKGRHTCPGRFFATDVIKLTLAYIALQYEIKPLPERPPNYKVGDTYFVPAAKIEVRRRCRLQTGKSGI
ncbi:Cytochrome P450 [Macrophomina phaseolina MS6]|uniref:Cytochrome P450 n=1 Tax=Macrophomina phaseolina (strain MS6) TaxID=1126212 RepID=K2RN78_MACPH|nr:Cytochrome P450 [Macrophomina phaseolina MS6]